MNPLAHVVSAALLTLAGVAAGRVGAVETLRWDREAFELRAVGYARTVHHRWPAHLAMCTEPGPAAREVLCVITDGHARVEALACTREVRAFGVTCGPLEAR